MEAHRDAADQEELDVCLDKGFEDSLDVELRRHAGGDRLRRPGT